MRTTRSLQLPRYLTPLVLFGIALALRVYRLDAQGLWLDEGSSWQMAGQPWGALLRDLLSPTAAYPLYHLLLKLWVSIFGDSEIALRMPSAIAGAAAVSAIYLAGLEAVGRRPATDDRRPATVPDATPYLRTPYRIGGVYRFAAGTAHSAGASGVEWAALAAAMIALAGPFPLWYAQEAKAYSLLLLAASMLTWALLRALRTDAGRDWLAFAAIAVAAVCVHRLAALGVV
ncbi:MAG: glycosyltransferase family 39 protein, partial [Chloroflexales bacterium]